MKYAQSALLLMSLLLSFTGCSLKYDEEAAAVADVPELIFKDVTYNRYKDNNLSMSLKAFSLEQYKNGDSAYADQAVFCTWDKDQQKSTNGSCGLLAIQSKDEIYKLFTDIIITDPLQNITLKAQSLSWNGKTEQLVSGARERVSITKDNLQIQGTGFSASGLSRTFAFNSNVSGSYTAEGEQ